MEGAAGKGTEEMHGKERQARERRKCMGRNDMQGNGGNAWEETTGKGTEEMHGKER